jgi:hypothetical protein
MSADVAVRVPADDPLADEDCGWVLGRESWTFHRWFFAILGRPTERGEYSFLLRQLRAKRDPELIVAGVYRLVMRDGGPIVVTGSVGYQPQLYSVLPAAWQIGDRVPWQRDPNHVRHIIKPKPAPRRVEAPAPPVLVAQPVPSRAPPAPAAKPPRKPTTLLLGGKNSDLAATLLEYRKRRWG